MIATDILLEYLTPSPLEDVRTTLRVVWRGRVVVVFCFNGHFHAWGLSEKTQCGIVVPTPSPVILH